VKLALADGVRRRREQLGLTQTQVAERLGSSQSRVAKMEAADRTVTTDLLLKSLFRLGASPRDVARLLVSKSRNRAA
jgi:transcriptional regulator with XRE-family HTH domain